MLSLKKNIFLKSKMIGYVDSCSCIKQQKQYLRILKKDNCSAVLYCKEKRPIEYCTNMQSDINFTSFTSCIRKLSTKTLSMNDNGFGNISDEIYEKIELDKDEIEVEKFATNTVNIPKWEKLNFSEYYKLIKSYSAQKDIESALSVLDLMKRNGDKPTLYVYKLLLCICSQQGDIKRCFKLFKQVKDRGLTPSPSMYTSLIQACAQSTDTNSALQHLHYIRTYCYKNKMNLNVIQYCALIKAYGRHKQILTAFEIADEVKDSGIVANSLFIYLLQATISHKEGGLKYALILWHKMKKNNVKLNILHYNLLLRAIRDTNFGYLDKNGASPFEFFEAIQYKPNETCTDLLHSPPLLSSSLFKMVNTSVNINNLIANCSELKVVNNIELMQKLNQILIKNPLVLFGGINKLLERMAGDGVIPDEKTITFLLELLPFTDAAEKYLLTYVKKKNISVSVTFFNMLIKRKCKRRLYNDAKDVLNDMQYYHLMPNIVTFGVLAIGCTRYKDGVELLNQMDNIGYAPNYKILETLLLNACYHKSFSYILYLMHYVLKNQIKPSVQMLKILEKFDEIAYKLIKTKRNHIDKGISFTMEDYNKFKGKYENWKEKI